MIFITRFPKPAILTYVGIVCAVIGIVSALQISLAVSVICLGICAAIDMYDGKFAGQFTRSNFEKRFGSAIDALSDTLAFIALPVVVLISIDGSMVSILVATLYALCGITRLAVFEAETSPGERVSFYRGLPVTVAGLVIPATVATIIITGVSPTIIMNAIYAILAVLFITNIRIKKP